jgi:ATP-dependent Clp protease protease subunit
MSEFKKYAIGHLGISSSSLDRFAKFNSIAPSNITPYILEEREMRVTQMDIFSRLMMDRTIFLGSAINDEVSNIIIGQLLFLQSLDPGKDIQMYINSPGGGVYAGLGIYDTMQLVTPDVSDSYCVLAMYSPHQFVSMSATHVQPSREKTLATI